jgi:predicted PurR-regulated permease PerM
VTADLSRFNRQVFAAVLIVGLVIAVAYSFQILLLVFAGILLALMFRSAGTWLHDHTKLSINWCMALVLAGFAIFFFGSIWMFGVQIINQADELFWAVSQAYAQFHDKLAQYHVAGSLSAGTGGLNLESPAKAVASSALWLIAALVMVLFLGIYLSTNPQLYTELFLGFFDGRLRARIVRILDALASALRWWLAGQLFAMTVVGIITTGGLLLIGAPMAISLGVMAALLTFVPYVGAIVSAIPAVLLAFTKSADLAFYTILVFLIAHIAEGYIVVPLVQHRLVYLPPAMILAMQFLMDLFFGTVGVTFATPLMVVAMVLIKNLYFKQAWDDTTEQAPAA